MDCVIELLKDRLERSRKVLSQSHDEIQRYQSTILDLKITRDNTELEIQQLENAIEVLNKNAKSS